MKTKAFKKLKIGDKVRVVDNVCDHNYEIGDVITVTYRDATYIRGTRPGGCVGNNLQCEDVDPALCTIEHYQGELDRLSAATAEIEVRIACMQTLGVETLDENEYRVYRAL